MGLHVYRGWKSTKLHLALLTMAVITAVYARAGFPDLQFENFCLALLGAAGIYSGTSTADKFAAARASPAAVEGVVP